MRLVGCFVHQGADGIVREEILVDFLPDPVGGFAVGRTVAGRAG